MPNTSAAKAAPLPPKDNHQRSTSIPCNMAAEMKGDLHGNVPDSAPVVLLLIDVLNDLDFPQNEYLLSQAPGLAAAIRSLKQRCSAAGIPAIYVNDNHGKWRSDSNAVVQAALRPGSPGHDFVAELLPDAEDYVVLKPKHSAFFATPLEVLLQSFGAKTLIMVGVTANACVLISAGDAYVNGYKIHVPQDCVGSLTPDAHDKSLQLMQQSFAVDTTPGKSLELAALARKK